MTETDLSRLTPIAPPLVTDIYTADPSVRVFDGTVYVYVSHDVESDVEVDDSGEHFRMVDYYVLVLDGPQGPARAHGPILHVDDVPWATRQMWAPDVEHRDGRYYLYFPAKDDQDRFRIGVAVADSPTGPFVAVPEPMAGTYSIDPAVLTDDDGASYIYFGGLWGGQLQQYRDNSTEGGFDLPADDEPALGPRVARLADSMTELAEPTREVVILDENGEPLRAADTERRFFEGPWVHRYQDRYYLSYSTGETHLLCYAVGDNPYGPFTYQGRILSPVVGWTTQHSICEVDGRWYLYFHDSYESGGQTPLRSARVTELHYDADGRIIPIEPYRVD